MTAITKRRECRDPIGCSHDGICTCPDPILSPGFDPALAPKLPDIQWHPLGGIPPRQTPGGHYAHYDYEVKSWPWLFEPMVAGQKTHDMRDKRDRPYKVGDRMLLREFDPRTGRYTGREAVAYITYITDNVTPCAMSSNALSNDHAILSVTVSELGDCDRNA